MLEIQLLNHSTMASPLQALMNSTSYDGIKHPYYPLDANIVGYVANESTVLSLLGSFVAGCVAIFGLTYLAVKKVNPRLPTTELMTVSRVILRITMPIWVDCRHSLGSSGKSMHCQIPGI
ncbi:hypothetical protein KCU81_g603, partial [Aureobasidium melanogenum]